MSFYTVTTYYTRKIQITFSLAIILSGCGQNELNSTELSFTTTKHTQAETKQAQAVFDPPSEQKQPNILLILVDDMGFTDIGAFGSEIKTPHLDQIANSGMKFTNFHASPQCAPTRAILMSGNSNHTAGLGSMFGSSLIEGDFGDRPGYVRHLQSRVASLPERLKEAGYATYITGKWHLGNDENKKPTARGFDQSFALMGGNANHMELRGPGTRPAVYRENGEILKDLPEDFYSTDTFTQKMIDFIDSERSTGKPFFGYLGLTSPHWPLQAPEEYKNLYAGRYDKGYDELRLNRLKKAEALGVIPKVDPALFDLHGKHWDELSSEEQKYSARTMELYAAMIANMDDNIGKITSYLEKIDEFPS